MLLDVSGSEIFLKAPLVCSTILLSGLVKEEKYFILLEPTKPLGWVLLISTKVKPGLTKFFTIKKILFLYK